MKRTFVKVLSLMLALAMMAGSFVTVAYAEDALTCPGKNDRHTLANTGDYTVVKVYEPVCEEDGYTSYKCNICGVHFVDSYVEAEDTAHAWGDVVEAVAPTCGVAGTKAYQQCANCESYLIDGVSYRKAEGELAIVDPALTHNYVMISSTGSCLEEGVETWECTNCGDTYTVEIDGTGVGHNWVLESIDEEPSVDADGNLVAGSATYVCSECGATEVFPVNCDHDFAPADCTTPATCKVCGFTTGAANGHTVVIDPAVAPTCTTTGLTEGAHCGVCGEELVAQDEVDPALCVGATLVEFGAVVGKCTTPAVTAGTKCSVCEHVWTEPVVGDVVHDLDTVITPATCTLPEIYVVGCRLCDYSDQYFGEPRLGHTANYSYEEANEKGLVTAYTAATCEVDGSYTYKCERCDETFTYDIAATEHSIQSVSVDATCIQYAYTYTYCSNDNCDYASVASVVVDGVAYDLTVNGNNVNYAGDIVVDVEGGKDGGAEGNHTSLRVDEYINNPTCTEKGNGIVYCADCGYRSVVVELPAKGHSWEADADSLYEDRITAAWESAVVTDPDCTTKGYTTYTCTDCDATVKNLVAGDDVAALGHNSVIELEAEEPTCTQTGLTQGWQCDRCDAITTPQTVIGKLDHDWVYSATVAPKCDGTQGYDIYVCDREDCDDLGCEDYRDYTDYDWNTTESYESVEAANKIHDLDLATETIKYVGDCVNGPMYQYTCIDCEKDVLITLPTQHDWVEEDEVPASCTTSGTKAGRYCSICGTREGYAVIPETGHTYVDQRDADNHWEECACGDKINVTAHTWTPNNDEDNHWVECACGQVKDVVAHTYTSETILNETCTTIGTEKYTCTCGHTYEEDRPEFGHNYVATGVVSVLGCITDRYVEYQCTICGIIYLDEYLPAFGHTEVIDEAVAPDCDDTGLTKGRHCYICGDADENYYIAQEEIPATGIHKNSDGEVLVDSCLDTNENRVCVECGETVGQTHGEDEIKTFAPTCINIGYTTRVCLTCGAEIAEPTNVQAPIGDAGHDWTEWTTVDGVICTEVGAQIRTCNICGEEEARATTHTTANNAFKFNADEHWNVCDVCDAEIADTREDHDWVEREGAIAPQPGIPGVSEYDCVCGATKTEYPEFAGLKVSFDYDNYIYNGAAVVNGGLVVLNVYLEGTEVKVENIQIKFTYDATRLTYVSDSWDLFETAIATCREGNGTIYLEGKKGETSAHSAVTVDGQTLVGQIVFRIDDFDDILDPDADIDATNTTINFTNVAAITPEDKDEDGYNDYIAAKFANGEATDTLDIVVEKLGAISTNDKFVGINDASAIKEFVYDSEAEYNARADINQDGYVDVFDYVFLAEYLGGRYTYAEFVALGVR